MSECCHFIVKLYCLNNGQKLGEGIRTLTIPREDEKLHNELYFFKRL
jgi:hypothetical protein